jgi:hypothetical protein
MNLDTEAPAIVPSFELKASAQRVNQHSGKSNHLVAYPNTNT